MEPLPISVAAQAGDVDAAGVGLVELTAEDPPGAVIGHILGRGHPASLTNVSVEWVLLEVSRLRVDRGDEVLGVQ